MGHLQGSGHLLNKFLLIHWALSWKRFQPRDTQIILFML